MSLIVPIAEKFFQYRFQDCFFSFHTKKLRTLPLLLLRFLILGDKERLFHQSLSEKDQPM